MSMKTYVEAIEYVLDTELDARNDLICFRPGARRALEEAERDVPLPRIGKKAFSVALGAALYGMHPVLDLRQESGAAQLLKEALDDLSMGMALVMTVIACAEDRELIMELPGVYVLEPKTPRQAAGFLRSALKLQRLTVVLVDQTLFAEEDDIPEDRSFALLPLESTGAGEKNEPANEAEGMAEPAAPSEAADTAESDQAAAYISDEMDEESAYDEAEAEEVCVIVPDEADEEIAYMEAEREPVRVVNPAQPSPEAVGLKAESDQVKGNEYPAQRTQGYLATRQMHCSLKEIHSLCAMLEMDEDDLVERCAGHVLPVYGGFELHYEANAASGEAAFLPPEEETASVWLGSDMLTISYDPARMEHAEAAELLRAVKRVVEKPQLLIYDKEYDKR